MAVKSHSLESLMSSGVKHRWHKPYERSAYRYWYRKDLGHEG